MTSLIEHHNLHGSLEPFKPPGHPHLPQQSPISITQVDEIDNVEYRFEAARLQSYHAWPVRFMDPAKLAAAGFYYTGENDKVRCFECGVEISQWLEGDNPMVDHQRWSGRCRFIRKIPCGNVPVGVDPGTIPSPRPRSRDVCGPYGVEYRPGSGPDCESHSPEFQLPSIAKLGSLGLGRPKGPVYPEYASHEARIRTFESWPKAMPQTKEQLADAGFYYTGKGDQTLCYHCGGGLKDWEPEDDPWEQHAKWFSKCYYLLTVKGQSYVNGVTAQNVPPLSKEEMMQMNLPSCIEKIEFSAVADAEAKHNAENNPGPSSEGVPMNNESQASGVKSLEFAKSSLEDLSNTKTANNKPVDDARICKICYNEELGVVFLPCGHMVACAKCAPNMKACAVCREPVSMIVRAFFS